MIAASYQKQDKPEVTEMISLKNENKKWIIITRRLQLQET